jgi:hypothetical protein
VYHNIRCVQRLKKKLEKETFGERFIVPRQEFELNEAIRLEQELTS